MDRFGLDIILPFEQRVDTVAALARRGYADRMVLSHDAACYIDWFRQDLIPGFAPAWHFGHLFDDVLPALRERGVTEAQIQAMLVANPRRYFSGRPARDRRSARGNHPARGSRPNPGRSLIVEVC